MSASLSTSSGSFRRITEAVFFGNYFYGLCAVGLAVEAGLQQRVPLQPWTYYAALFLGTVVYYTHAYRWNAAVDAPDPRARWYAQNRRAIGLVQVLLTVLAGLLGWMALRDASFARASFTATHVGLLALFPLAGAAYYGLGTFDLRSVGWMKPFLIGFVWAGVVTVYPAVFANAMDRLYPFPTRIGSLLFLKNLMFIGMLCVLFDIKDLRADRRAELRTFIVQHGLRRTLFRFVLPLVLVGFVTFLLYATTHGFSFWKIALNAVPFLLLIAVAYALRRRRPLLYYLVVVDGLMLVKAVCGIVAMRYF
ncbi:MAG TPA: hypothetical protein VHL57_02015 [Flavobacteriales bacterium]|nr:hypothetical protein [Flavobacteriales bacterium]